MVPGTLFRTRRDDHDFGMNNAGGDWSEKVFAQKAFLDFLGEPATSPRRKRKGVYESYTFRGLGRGKDRSMRLVLLDTRYDMSRDQRVLLGEDQWTWLETLLVPYGPDVYGGGGAQAEYCNSFDTRLERRLVSK